MYNFNFNESDLLSKSQNENILDEQEEFKDEEDFDFEDFVQQAIASGDIDTLVLINEIEVEEEKDDEENHEIIEDDESFSIVEKDGQNWKVLSTAKGKYNAARKYNECITTTKNEVRLVSLKDLEKMDESRKNEAPANSESLFTALMSELNPVYKCEITDEGFLKCVDDGGNFIEVATVKNTDPVELGMRVNFTDGTQSETVYYVYDNIQAVNDFIQAVFISEVNAFNDMNEVEAEEVQKEEKEDIEIEDENQAQEEIDKNVEEVEEESEEEKTESLKRKSKNESKVTPEKIKKEVEEKLKNIYKDYPEFYEEYVYVDTYYRDEDGRLVVEVRAELGYDDMISLSEELDSIVQKYDKYAYFDQVDGGIMNAILDFDEKYESLNESDDKFNYMMLDRLRTDCEYFLGNGNGYEKHLWAGNIEDQIAEMRKIYDELPEKPEWLSLEDIDRYEKEMLTKRDSKNEVKEITRDEWNKTPKDYKMIKDGKPYLVYLDDETHATVLGPCKIVDESLEDYDDPQGQIILKDAKKQFEKLVAEAHDVHWQGYKFIDITLLETHCPAFHNISWEDIPELIRSWGYVVLEDSGEEEPAIALGKEFTEDDIKKMVYDFNKENGFYESLNKDNEFKVKVTMSDGKEKFYKAKDLLDAKGKFSDLCIRFNNCELLQGDKVLYKQHESLNEDGTVSDMGVAPIMPASYDDIDDIDDIDDELFDMTEGFLFPDSGEESDEDKEEEVNSLMGAAIEDINQGQPTASEWIEDAQYVFNSIKDDTIKNRLRSKYSQYLESKKNESSDDELGLYIINTRRMCDKYCSPAIDKIRQGKEDEVDWFKIAIEGAKMYAREIEPLHLNQEDYRRTADYIRDYYINLAGDPQDESFQKNEASAELNKVLKDLAANDKTDVDKEINKLYKEEPDVKSNVADGSPILGATSPDNIVPTIDKAIMNKAIFAATSYANNGPQMFAKLQESFKNIDRKTLDDLMNSEDIAGIAKYLYESEMKVNKNEDTFTDPQMNVVNSNSTTVATGNSPETPKLADDIDPAPTEVQGFPKDKSEIENTNANDKDDQLAKDSGTEDISTT